MYVTVQLQRQNFLLKLSSLYLYVSAIHTSDLNVEPKKKRNLVPSLGRSKWPLESLEVDGLDTLDAAFGAVEHLEQLAGALLGDAAAADLQQQQQLLERSHAERLGAARGGGGVARAAEAPERRHGEIRGHVGHAEHLLDEHGHSQRVRARGREPPAFIEVS